MKKKSCSYCKNVFDGNIHKKTKEHIFPNGIIKLYPEQYINYSTDGNYIDKSGSVIKDVCAKCNNGTLSDLDGYGVSLIENKFYEKLEQYGLEYVHNINLNYNLLSRWLLKIIYNYLRQKKQPIDWFDNAIPFILNNNLLVNVNFSIFAGIHINASPLPEEFFAYTPMELCPEPRLLGNSLNVLAFKIDPFVNSIKLKDTFFTIAIRFGTAVFYVILWNRNAIKSNVSWGNKLIENEFNFIKLISSKEEYNLIRISSHTNSSIGYNHLISASGLEFDRKTNAAMTGNAEHFEKQTSLRESFGEDGVKKSRVLVEKAMFPDNKFIEKNYQKIYGKEGG